MIDLMIPFSGDRSSPFYEQIYSFIKKDIQDGNIQAGDKLPSTRQLAQKLGVSRSTTQLAYDQLTAEGYLEARPGSGYYAEDLSLLYNDKAINGGRTSLNGPRSDEGGGVYRSLPDEERGELHRGYGRFGDDRQQTVSSADRTEGMIDFSPRGIDLSHFPFNTWRKLSREVLREENSELFASGEPRGELRLRAVICDYLQASRGIACHPEQLVIGAGSEYLLMILTQLTGIRKIAMENPTYRQAARVLKSLGNEICPLSMDRSGMRSDLLEESGADLAYIMPSHQFPTGAVMPLARRQEILHWADQAGERFIIEDDYDSEFRYRGRPIPALCGSDRSGKVIYLGTFSKSVAPAIRVSYMVLPEELSRRYDENCGFYASTVSRVDQEILRRFMQEGYFERHLNRMRGIYRNKHDILLEALEPVKTDFRIQGEMAGLHVLLESRAGQRESELIRLAEDAGVYVYGMSSCLLEEAESCTVLLGYANLSEEEIREGAEKLRKAWMN